MVMDNIVFKLIFVAVFGACVSHCLLRCPVYEVYVTFIIFNIFRYQTVEFQGQKIAVRTVGLYHVGHRGHILLHLSHEHSGKAISDEQS